MSEEDQVKCILLHYFYNYDDRDKVSVENLHKWIRRSLWLTNVGVPGRVETKSDVSYPISNFFNRLLGKQVGTQISTSVTLDINVDVEKHIARVTWSYNSFNDQYKHNITRSYILQYIPERMREIHTIMNNPAIVNPIDMEAFTSSLRPRLDDDSMTIIR